MIPTYSKESEPMMLDIVNEWHLQVGIDEVMKTKLTKAIADTVATGVVDKHIDIIRNAERERCANIATGVFLNGGTCKFKTKHGEGWNSACWDINHRIMDPEAYATVSPGPAMVRALQAVKHEGDRLSAATLAMVDDALEQFKNPKDL